MKIISSILVLLVLLSFTACAGQSGVSSITAATVDTSPPTPTLPPSQVFTTSMGDFEIQEVRPVDEVNGVTAGPDERILLVILQQADGTQLDPASFALETFQAALSDQSNGEVHIAGDDGSYVICSMAGWVGENYDQFAMGFRVNKTARSFQFFWPGNEAIDLQISE
jgi:hypothetical protein